MISKPLPGELASYHIGLSRESLLGYVLDDGDIEQLLRELEELRAFIISRRKRRLHREVTP